MPRNLFEFVKKNTPIAIFAAIVSILAQELYQLFNAVTTKDIEDYINYIFSDVETLVAMCTIFSSVMSALIGVILRRKRHDRITFIAIVTIGLRGALFPTGCVLIVSAFIPSLLHAATGNPSVPLIVIGMMIVAQSISSVFPHPKW